MIDPVIVDELLTSEDYEKLVKAFDSPKRFEYSPAFGRYCAADRDIPEFNNIFHSLTNRAREVFGSDTLLPTYALFAHYESQDPAPSLFKHKDDNACTYTLDMCVYQSEPWDLWVEDKSYTLYPNQALAYYGNDQLHWREEFPNPEKNFVAMVFFHFAEPDHWYFTKGPSYLNVIRKTITEQEWEVSGNNL